VTQHRPPVAFTPAGLPCELSRLGRRHATTTGRFMCVEEGRGITSSQESEFATPTPQGLTAGASQGSTKRLIPAEHVEAARGHPSERRAEAVSTRLSRAPKFRKCSLPRRLRAVLGRQSSSAREDLVMA